jgi:hypothetical protein
MNELKVSINFNALRNIPVSFIIHCQNDFQNISILLENLMTNIYNPLEIILINDRSLNKEYFNQIKDRYKFINYLISEKTYGDAINLGLDNCVNNWIFYINSNFKPNNSSWCSSLFNSMQSLKRENVKIISPFIVNNSFYNYYKENKKDIILTEHFLPFNVLFFHKDLFKTIGNVESTDEVLSISSSVYSKMNKRGFKQGISRSSLFI